MKIQVIEKECVAKVGLSVEFSNSECASIKDVKTRVSDAIENAVKEATAYTEAPRTGQKFKSPSEITVKVDLETAMRIDWLLSNFVRKEDSGLFCTADNLCLTTMAEINHEENELNTQLAQ